MICDGCKGPCCIDWQGNVKSHWWDKRPGYYRDEVRAALRRASDSGKPHWLQRAKLPTLAASSKRLREAELTLFELQEITSTEPQWNRDKGAYEWVTATKQTAVLIEVWRGPRAAEQYVLFRREQLGLSNEWPKETAVAA